MRRTRTNETVPLTRLGAVAAAVAAGGLLAVAAPTAARVHPPAGHRPRGRREPANP